MGEEVQQYEMVLFTPDVGAMVGVFKQARTDAPATRASVTASIGGLLEAGLLHMVEFPNPGNPLHWHVLFWDAEGLVKGLPLNRQVVTLMREMDADFPDVYGRVALIRDKFWTDEPKESVH